MIELERVFSSLDGEPVGSTEGSLKPLFFAV
jgi:hypothetical protein